MPEANSWIQASDFIETVFELSVQNVTTHSKEATKNGIEVIELQKAGLVMRLPKKIGASGHLVLLKITRKKSPESLSKAPALEITATAKILSTEEFQKDSMVATLQFYQYNEKEWEELLAECAARQLKSNTIVKRIQE